MPKAPIPWRRITTEFVVIFAGITLSLAADDWRQGIEDRKREAQLLGDVVADLERDSVELAQILSSMERWDAASLWINRNESRGDVPGDTALLHFRSLGIVSFYQPVSSAYMGLRDAGLMHLVRDDEVRAAIVDYYEVRQPYMLQFFSLVHEGWGRWFDVSSGFLDWDAPPDGTTMWASHRNMSLTQSWPVTMADTDLERHVDRAGLIAGNTIARVRPVLEVNAALRRDLSDYIGS